jgi:RNA polymerase sigma-70 factor (ECF subfamily)
MALAAHRLSELPVLPDPSRYNALPVNPKTSSDAGLVSQIERGDADALAELYDRHAGRLLGLTARILADEAEAEDVAQEVFLHVWRNPASYDASRGEVLSWLLVLARSRAIDRLRALRRRGRELQVEIEAVPLASAEDTESRAADGERREAIGKLLGELPAEQRQALELAYFGGYTQNEIAGLMKSPLGTVKTRIRQGTLKLREQFQAYLRRGSLGSR